AGEPKGRGAGREDVGRNLRAGLAFGLGVTLAMAALASAGGCSIQRVAVRSLGDMLASGDSTYASDDDPELIEAALPFGLKLIDGLLEQQPEHRGLLLAASRGYLLYAHAFVAIPAEQA